MTRRGKIARLSREIREQLNRRLDNAEPGQEILAWLNSLSEVQRTLQHQFEGRPITKQNLSEWRLGGYQEWLRHQKASDHIWRLTERADDLDDAADGLEVSDRLAPVLAAELAQLAEKLLEETADPGERWRQLRGVLHELRHLRHEDHNARRLQMERERWELEQAQEEKLRKAQELDQAKERAAAPIWAGMMKSTLAKAFGGGEVGEKFADVLLAIYYGVPFPSEVEPPHSDQGPSHPVQPGPAQSNPIQPDQTQCPSMEP